MSAPTANALVTFCLNLTKINLNVFSFFLKEVLTSSTPPANANITFCQKYSELTWVFYASLEVFEMVSLENRTAKQNSI